MKILPREKWGLRNVQEECSLVADSSVQVNLFISRGSLSIFILAIATVL